MNLQPGTVIRAQVKDLPFIYHYGIVATDAAGKTVVLHNTPDEGGTVVSPFPEFMQSRILANTYHSGMDNTTLWQRFESCKGTFNLFFYNCEHFIDAMLGRAVQRSEQVTFWVIFLFVYLLIYFIFSGK